MSITPFPHTHTHKKTRKGAIIRSTTSCIYVLGTIKCRYTYQGKAFLALRMKQEQNTMWAFSAVTPIACHTRVLWPPHVPLVSLPASRRCSESPSPTHPGLRVVLTTFEFLASLCLKSLRVRGKWYQPPYRAATNKLSWSFCESIWLCLVREPLSVNAASLLSLPFNSKGKKSYSHWPVILINMTGSMQ